MTKVVQNFIGENGATFAIQDNAGTIELVLDGTAMTATAAELNAIAGNGLSAAELAVLDGVTAGTAAASKALVLDANKAISTITTATVTNLTTSALTLGATAVAASGTEINTRCDDSAMSETRADAGACSVTVPETSVTVSTSTQAITLAAPTKPAMIKIITMTANSGTSATLALTNVVGGSQTSTATFDSVGETLVLVSDLASGKWVVLAEVGVTLS